MARIQRDQKISEIMTGDPVTVERDTPIAEVARQMRDADTGAILVTDNGRLFGIATDRDIAVRAVADGLDPDTPADQVTTTDLRTLSPGDSVDDAIQTMRQDDVRRLPIVDGNRPVGIVSLGDLAIERDEDSVLADISSEPANN
ncbi:MAG TPA: CBS domain-containing protein [Thermoleophilaceae bacterium]